MKAMLFAAGLGTRLKPFTDTKPKALAEVNHKTLLEHSITYLQRFGIRDVIINVHHFAGLIREELAAHNNYGSNITISDETDEVLETGGGLLKASSYLSGAGDYVVMNVDVLTTLNLQALIDAHNKNKPLATLAVMQRESSRHLLFNNNMELCGWTNNNSGERKISKNETPLLPYAFSGIQVVSSRIWDGAPFSGKFSLIDLYLHAAKTGIVHGYNHSGDVFIDVGKPESLEMAAKMF